MARSGYDGTYIRRLQRGAVDRFWKGELHGESLTITEGDVSAPDDARTKVYKSPKATIMLADALLERGNEGYVSISPAELKALLRASKKATDRVAPKKPAPKKPPPKRPAPKKPPPKKPAPKKPPPKTPREPESQGPYARAMTSSSVFLPSLVSNARTGKSLPRATSGGRPILQPGQSWPVCSYCGQKLGLYLQFDIEARFGLAFAPGSHFLLFHCPDCRAIPPAPPRGRLPAAWARSDFRAAYRVMLNPPGVSEVALAPDPVIAEQKVRFTARKEMLADSLDGSVGVEEAKIGGAPHWVQPPGYPKCACGAPMAFVMQVPARKFPRWRRKGRGDGLEFAGELDAFVFFCSAQSSPYAGVIIVQR